MLGCHHHVSHPSLLGKPSPSACSVWLRIEDLCELLIFRNRNSFLLHRPFMTTQNAVQSKMDEHAEAGFVPPLHAAIAIRDCGRARTLLLGLGENGRSTKFGERGSGSERADDSAATDCVV